MGTNAPARSSCTAQVGGADASDVLSAVLERLEQGMHDHASKILFIAKLTVSFMIPSLIAAGLIKVPWKRWFPALFAGEMIWTGSLMLVGYFATEAIKKV